MDYALLHYDQPQVFIEAKPIGGAGDRKAREQLFGYAANRGIPILVLTDGLRWDFYFGTGPGVWEERCFRRLTLDDDGNVSDLAEFLTGHLGMEAVVSGKARRSADGLLAETQALERAKRTLPDVWHTLLGEPHPQLRDLLADTVQARCGVEPRADDVGSFLKDAAMGLRQWHPSDATIGVHGSEMAGPTANVRREGADEEHRESSGPGEEPMTAPPASEVRAKDPRSRQGLKTPSRDFRRPILQVLIEMGGRGERKQVLEQVGAVMASRLRDYDRETLKDGSLRWKKTAEFQCTEMRKVRLLKSGSRKGLWEISDQGRAYWKEQR